jgi:hypothetical protein
MSLLDRGPHTVQVEPRTRAGVDRANNPTYGYGPPITVQGVSVQPTSSTGARGGRDAGAQPDEAPVTLLMKVIGRGPWPGGRFSRVTYRGRAFDQIGEALVRTTGRRTHHFVATIRARTGEVH